MNIILGNTEVGMKKALISKELLKPLLKCRVRRFNATKGEYIFSPAQNEKKCAFTLAEVLITLGIIGIIAALTLPQLIKNYQQKVLQEQFKVAYSLLQQTVLKIRADWDYVPECYYWEQKAATKCVETDDYGNCTKHTLADGSPLPSDYNGRFNECARFMEEIDKKLQVINTCKGQAYKKGCIPDYDGVDTVKQHNNPDMTDEEVTANTRNCSNFRKQNILNNLTVHVLKNGMIIIPYQDNSFPVWLVDINGKSGPNKWGYDMFTFQIKGTGSHIRASGSNVSCMVVEKGGKYTDEMIEGTFSNK